MDGFTTQSMRAAGYRRRNLFATGNECTTSPTADSLISRIRRNSRLRRLEMSATKLDLSRCDYRIVAPVNHSLNLGETVAMAIFHSAAPGTQTSGLRVPCATCAASGVWDARAIRSESDLIAQLPVGLGQRASRQQCRDHALGRRRRQVTQHHNALISCRGDPVELDDPALAGEWPVSVP
jgi:hypothetical protein